VQVPVLFAVQASKALGHVRYSSRAVASTRAEWIDHEIAATFAMRTMLHPHEFIAGKIVIRFADSYFWIDASFFEFWHGSLFPIPLIVLNGRYG